jgi:hypothetical protein
MEVFSTITPAKRWSPSGRPPVLEIGGQDRRRGIGAQGGEGRDIAVDRRHRVA